MTYVAIVLICLAFLAWREHAHTRERELLLNRIQAPEIAVAQSLANVETPPAIHVPVDDDAAFWEAREALNGGS